MDYEKMYKEALERARQFMSEHPTRAEADLMVALFPELSESEDERIRGEIMHHISLLEHCRFMVASKEECLAYLKKQKEQKPVEIHIDNPNIEKFDPDVKVTTSDSSADGKELLYVSNKSYDIGFRDGVASVKPADWSEEDEEMLEYIIGDVNDATQLYTTRAAKDMANKEIAWLKSLRPRPQGIYQQVVKGLRDMCDRYEQNGVFTDGRARDFLGNVRLKCKDAIECAPILDEPHWKPSEEQIQSLGIVAKVRDNRNCIVGSVRYYLKQLYEQLEKL